MSGHALFYAVMLIEACETRECHATMPICSCHDEPSFPKNIWKLYATTHCICVVVRIFFLELTFLFLWMEHVINWAPFVAPIVIELAAEFFSFNAFLSCLVIDLIMGLFKMSWIFQWCSLDLIISLILWWDSFILIKDEPLTKPSLEPINEILINIQCNLNQKNLLF